MRDDARIRCRKSEWVEREGLAACNGEWGCVFLSARAKLVAYASISDERRRIIDVLTIGFRAKLVGTLHQPKLARVKRKGGRYGQRAPPVVFLLNELIPHSPPFAIHAPNLFSRAGCAEKWHYARYAKVKDMSLALKCVHTSNERCFLHRRVPPFDSDKVEAEYLRYVCRVKHCIREANVGRLADFSDNTCLWG
ncbi:hypothetical protein IG631_22667 [Alternaria alternata]|nr:hypothetical protein IG631_22667 [Alternaria alternata]